LDLVVRGGSIIDGTGAPPFRGDVGVVDDRIVAIGDLSTAHAGVTVDAAGMVVAPGFIDVHAHEDVALLFDPTVFWKVRQGVTSLVVGNCGFGPAPHAHAIDEFAAWWPDVRSVAGWTDHHDYLRRVSNAGVSLNVAFLVGHGCVRSEAMGHVDRAPTDREMAAMRSRVEEGLAAGAVGMSTGLIYTPGRFADAAEIAVLARVVAASGGVYTSHIRDEGDFLVESVAEAIAIGVDAQLPVQLSHHKAYGPKNWGKVTQSLALVEAARAAGHDVSVDVYPYAVSATMLSALLDNEMFDVVDGSAVRITSAPGFTHYEGRTIAELSGEWAVATVAAAERVVADLGLAAMVVVESMSEDDVTTVLRRPFTMIGSDGIMGPGTPHPRVFGTFPRVLGRYVRDGSLTLADAVHRMTGLPADTFGLVDRGVVRTGAMADLVVFDADAIDDHSSYTDRTRTPTGIAAVIVNGRRVVVDGEHTGAGPGQVLRRSR
jgi:N-acyl-D-amino-acid deacylase